MAKLDDLPRATLETFERLLSDRTDPAQRLIDIMTDATTSPETKLCQAAYLAGELQSLQLVRMAIERQSKRARNEANAIGV